MLKNLKDNTGVLEPLDHKKAGNFFHCKHCIEQFLGSDLHQLMTPAEYGQYEASAYSLDGENIVVVWCKRCKREVWDSRVL